MNNIKKHLSVCLIVCALLFLSEESRSQNFVSCYDVDTGKVTSGALFDHCKSRPMLDSYAACGSGKYSAVEENFYCGRRDESLLGNQEGVSSVDEASSSEEQLDDPDVYDLGSDSGDRQLAPPLDAGVVNCGEDLSTLISECRNKKIGAENKCDDSKDSGIGSWTKSLEQGATLAKQAGDQMGLSQICGNVSNSLNGLSVALTAFKSYCAYSTSSCETTCAKVVNYERDHKCTATARQSLEIRMQQGNLDTCKGLAEKAITVQQSIGSLMQTAVIAANCSENSADAMVAICRANPSMPGCVGSNNSTDCSSPSNSAHPTCVCINNPNAPECGVSSHTQILEQQQASQISRSKDANLASDLLDDPVEDSISHVARRNGAVFESLGGAKGGGASLGFSGGGSGSSGGSGSDDGNASGSGLSAKVLSGYRGGGSISGGGGSSSSGNGSRQGTYSGASRGNTMGSGTVDLKQFLPGGAKHRVRGLSGGLARPEGVASEHGNLFKQVKDRYKKLAPTLLP